MAVRDNYSNFNYYQAIQTQGADNTAIAGAAVDTRGYEAVTFAVAVGLVESNTTGFEIQIQHTDASALGNGPSDFADVTSGSYIIHSALSANDTLTNGMWQSIMGSTAYGQASKVYIVGYKGPKRYVRLNVSNTLNGSINVGAIAILGYPANWPVNTPTQ